MQSNPYKAPDRQTTQTRGQFLTISLILVALLVGPIWLQLASLANRLSGQSNDQETLSVIVILFNGIPLVFLLLVTWLLWKRSKVPTKLR